MIARLVIWVNPIIMPITAFDPINWCLFTGFWTAPDFCNLLLRF